MLGTLGLSNDAALRARQEIEQDLDFRAFLDLEREPASCLVRRQYDESINDLAIQDTSCADVIPHQGESALVD